MSVISTTRSIASAAIVALLAVAVPIYAGEKKETPKMPDLDAKEWKKQDNGLQTWDVKEGTGEAVKEGAMLTVHYTGWFTNGKVFDSSTGGEPATFKLAKVIKGWQLGVPGMKEGGVRRLVIPSDLAYGDKGRDGIPGKSTLVFEIEVVRNWALPSIDAKEWKDVKNAAGLKYWDVKEGKGEACPEGALVNIHYTGWLTDGKIFDSSRDRGEPLESELSGLVKGWQLGVPGMKKGGVRRLLIPYQLAYGEKGHGPIPEKATLVFEIEMIRYADVK